MKGYYLKKLIESMMEVTNEAVKIVVDELEGKDRMKINTKMANENKEMIKKIGSLKKELEKVTKEK